MSSSPGSIERNKLVQEPAGPAITRVPIRKLLRSSGRRTETALSDTSWHTEITTSTGAPTSLSIHGVEKMLLVMSMPYGLTSTKLTLATLRTIRRQSLGNLPLVVFRRSGLPRLEIFRVQVGQVTKTSDSHTIWMQTNLAGIPHSSCDYRDGPITSSSTGRKESRRRGSCSGLMDLSITPETLLSLVMWRECREPKGSRTRSKRTSRE